MRFRRDTDCAFAALSWLGIGLALAAGATAGALAHVEIDVGDGQYVMEVGFRDEPAYLGQPNALALQRRAVRHRRHGTGQRPGGNPLRRSQQRWAGEESVAGAGRRR